MDYMTPAGPQLPGTSQGDIMQGQPVPMPEIKPMPQELPPAAPNPASELNKLLEQLNVAEELDKEKLDKIGSDVYDGYKIDLQSKEAWDQQVDEWVKLAAQIKGAKNTPWQHASNVKYPLLATAAMQFAARAYPSLIPADGKLVQFKVVGADPQGGKALKADKLAKHMNYQIMKDMDNWEEEMDRLLIQLPVVGCLFKKTYFDSLAGKNASKLIGPKDLVVNYWAQGLESCHRKTEIIPMTKNQLKSMQNAGLYLDVELPEPNSQPQVPSKSDVHGGSMPSQRDDTTPYVILEQHTFLDMDEDGYQEPYIITIEEQSKTVLRIVARFDSDGIKTNEDGDVISIKPVEYYTKYEFVPNPDGGFYGIGFGHLLGHLNESVNTIINQLIDAGTLSNLQSGFLGKGLRMKLGDTKFQPGEWKSVNASGDDIRKQVFPLPVREPSKVLMELLGMLIDSGRQLASVAEIFTGKMPGQNTPATTTQSAIEQGMKVFTAIYKRVYRSLTQEFEKLFRLNSLYDENFVKAQAVLDEEITKEDYDPRSYDICPTADPQAASTTQKQMKAQQLMEILPLGTLNIMEVTKRVLEAQEQPNLETIMQQPQPQPDPKVMQMQAKMQMDQEKHKLDMTKTQMEAQTKAQSAMMEQKFMAAEKQMEMRFKEMEMQMEAKHNDQKLRQEGMKSIQEHAQTVVQSDEKHKQGLQQMKEKADAQRNARDVAGVGKPPSNSRKK